MTQLEKSRLLPGTLIVLSPLKHRPISEVIQDDIRPDPQHSREESPSNETPHQVLLTLYAVGSVASKNGYEGPCIGAKLSEANPREFTEEQLKQGETMIGMQMGNNKGASQSGMSMGKTRKIMD